MNNILEINKVIKYPFFFTALACCIFLGCNTIFAANQGRLGATSSGDINIDLVLGSRVQLTGLSDINFGDWDGENNLIDFDDVCIYSTSSKYQITATGNGGSSGKDFAIKNYDTGDNISYLAAWNDEAYTNSNYTQLTSDVTLENQTGGDNINLDCNGVDNARLILFFTSDELSQVYAGEYSGILTIAIAPE
jgi:hypothetical protein